MDYEKKYKEALEGIRELYNSDCDMIRVKRLKRRLKLIFPELKESEDERMRKEIIDFLRLPHPQFVGKRDHEKWIAWLEKQADKDKLIRELGEYKVKYTQKVLQEDLNKNTESQSQPKFKVGYWITDGRLTCKVLGVTGKSYELHLHNDDYCHFETDIQSVDKYYRLWAIQDAEDGDVLVGKDNRPFIFTGEFDVQDDNPTAYCGINSSDKFITGMGSHWTFKDGIKPATKEQRDLLFQKMKEAGYEWDAQKKEVKKPIDEVKSRFKEGDFIMNNDITEDGKPEIFKIIKVCSNWYEVENVYDGRQTMITFSQEYTCHLWTIDDAKKGDILVVDGIYIVEFDKKMTDGCPWKKNSILTSVEYDMDDDICTTGSHIFYDDIWPASKEDIDLFKKKRNQYLTSNSHDESNFNVGDKVTVEGDDTIYTIHSINLDECWLTHEGRGRGWAKLDSLKHYVEQ